MTLKELKIDFTKSNSELRQLGYRLIDGRRFLDFIRRYHNELNLGLVRMDEYIIDLDTNEQLASKKYKVSSEYRVRDGLSPQHHEHPSALLTHLIQKLTYIYNENVATAVRIIAHPKKPTHLILDTLYQIGEDTDTEHTRYRQVVRLTLQSITTYEILYRTYMELKPFHSERGGFFWRDVSEVIAQLPYHESDVFKLPKEEVRYAPVSMIEEIIEHPLACVSNIRIQTFEMGEMQPQTITRTETLQIEVHRHFKDVGVQEHPPNQQGIQALKNYINEMKSGKSIVTFRETDDKLSRFTLWYVRESDGKTVVESIKLGLTCTNTHDSWQQIAINHKWFKRTHWEQDMSTQKYPYATMTNYEKIILRAI